MKEIAGEIAKISSKIRDKITFDVDPNIQISKYQKYLKFA